MNTKSENPSLFAFRWFKTLVGTVLVFLFILLGLPLLYELFVAITPALDPATERTSRSAVSGVSNVFSWLALILGALLAWRQWQTQRRRKYLHQRILQRQREKRAEAERARHERLFGKKTKKPPQSSE